MGKKVPKKATLLGRILSVVVFVVAALAIAYVISMMCGCAVGQSLDDDSPMLGLKVNGSGDASQLFGTVGGLLFGTPGKVGGAALGSLLFGRSMGRHRGWDENEESRTPKKEA